MRVVLRLGLVALAAGVGAACTSVSHQAGRATSSGRPPPTPASPPSVVWGTKPWEAPVTTAPTKQDPPGSASIPSTRRTAATPVPIPAGGVSAVGDSVMLDAEPSLEAAIPGVAVNGSVGRQVDQGIAVIAQLRAAGGLGKSVVFALGTNGTFSPSEFSQLVRLTAGRHLVVVTNHCGHCGWTITNNAMIRANCGAATHCTVADWYPLAQGHPAWFVDGADGVHMPTGGTGTQAYAAMVRGALIA
jgi:hypothetical protein